MAYRVDAGIAVIDARGWTKDRKEALVEGFGVFRDPAVLRPVLLFAATAMPKAKLRKWLAERAEVARPELLTFSRTAKDVGVTAATTKRVQKRLDEVRRDYTG